MLSLPLGAQGLDGFLRPSDTLHVPRRNAVVIGESVLGGGTLFALSQAWYADYPKSDFHFTDDSGEWLQIDKAGHVFSAYHMGRIGYDLLDWSGVRRRGRLIYGGGLGFAFLTVVEVMDGHSAKWGASWSDIAANTAGTALFVGQELLWQEQRIIPKFSFHTTRYATMRPDALGQSLPEQLLKDYNGQTYWLSANIETFAKTGALPSWLNVAIGYGGDGMITGEPGDPLQAGIVRRRQFYLSLDVDLTRIRTKSHFLKTLFSVLNTVKVPAPALELRGAEGLRGHFLYF